MMMMMKIHQPYFNQFRVIIIRLLMQSIMMNHYHQQNQWKNNQINLVNHCLWWKNENGSRHRLDSLLIVVWHEPIRLPIYNNDHRLMMKIVNHKNNQSLNAKCQPVTVLWTNKPLDRSTILMIIIMLFKDNINMTITLMMMMMMTMS